jgi:hypothetical protein
MEGPVGIKVFNLYFKKQKALRNKNQNSILNDIEQLFKFRKEDQNSIIPELLKQVKDFSAESF